jgi:hypothetical protein
MPRKLRTPLPAPTLPTLDPASVSPALAHTETFEDEVERLRDRDLSTVNIYEVDKRVALLGRIIIEGALRSKGQMSLREKADIALRAIQCLEGLKSKSELWVRDSTPVPISVEELEDELSEREERLMRLADSWRSRKDAANAREALKALGEDVTSNDIGEA